MRIFSIPTGLSGEAAHMLAEVLQENRYRRPTADQCLQLDFIHGFILPKSLPVYSLLSEPRPEDIPFDEGRCTNFPHMSTCAWHSDSIPSFPFRRWIFRVFFQARRSSSSWIQFDVRNMPGTKFEWHRCIVSTSFQRDRQKNGTLHWRPLAIIRF